MQTSAAGAAVSSKDGAPPPYQSWPSGAFQPRSHLPAAPGGRPTAGLRHAIGQLYPAQRVAMPTGIPASARSIHSAADAFRCQAHGTSLAPPIHFGWQGLIHRDHIIQRRAGERPRTHTSHIPRVKFAPRHEGSPSPLFSRLEFRTQNPYPHPTIESAHRIVAAVSLFADSE